ncbi:MAG: Gfo/Idh/MocA family oxidoreductase [Kiritimatiellae bacterium]|nr:Gfo/Idh/MocA family oxidoreductase [Kiritimatiellia bacterium]
MSESTVRIGFVGVGSMGQCAHLRNYAVSPGCEVVALAELRERTGRLVAQRYGVARVYKTADRMLAEEHLDGIVASQPFTRHGVMLERLARYGRPIFIEKPLARSVQVGEAILAALDGAAGRVMVGYHKRSDPATMYASAEIARLKQTGELGRLKYVRVTMPPGDWIAGGFDERLDGADPRPGLPSDPAPADMDTATQKRYEGFVNYYIHQVNLLRHLLGEPYEVTFADPAGVLLAGHSANGAACLLEMAPYRTSIDWQESALVAFERGYVRLELPAPLASNRPGRVELLRDPGNGETPVTLTPQLPWCHAMKQQALNFLKVVRGEAPPPCDAREALEDLRVARTYVRMMTGKDPSERKLAREPTRELASTVLGRE